MPDSLNKRKTVAILGAGPVGLAAAAHVLERGMEPVVLEAGPQVGHAVRQWGHVPLPAQDALTQAVDLNRIAGFHYVSDTMLEVEDESGKKYNMEFTEPCPGLQGAKDFSMVTESYRDLDRFTGIAVQGKICTFKDFSPRA